ncbi:uncharacterized protein [Chironomus tepperi]|uniref:uncharacterized protein n=1 Tax=Chironomus tepperi TaxID=113505 RepID=UPI00391F8355
MLKILAFWIAIVCLNSATAQETCGKQQSAHQLIYGGSAVAKGEWPWIVSLFTKRNNQFFCSGNLISHQHVLTAAHCIFEKQSLGPKSINDIYAYIGRLDITPSINEPNAIQSDIRKIILNPSWNPKDTRFDADIAILVLKSPIEYSDAIQPVCLPAPTYSPFKTTGTVVGYGKSESDKLHETYPRKVTIKSSTNEECFFNDYNFAKYASPRTFCAGERGKTPCKGDSGSGYFVNDGKSLQIAGIVSAAIDKDCGTNDYVIFTNVAKFSDWITKEMSVTQNANSFDSVFNCFDGDCGTADSLDSNLVNAQCTFRNAGANYGCYVDDLIAPDNEIVLNINGGTHKSGRTSRDVSIMHMKGGKVTHFPDMTRVMQTFPKLKGFGITFTKLKHIDRKDLKGLEPMQFFLISDNEIEVIPPDTFLDLKNVELIDICRNKIKTLEADWIKTMSKLRVFKARSNKFQFVPPNMFNNNPYLEEILFDGNEIKRIDTNFMDLKNVKTIAILSNPCVSLKYCKDSEDDKCLKSIERFSYIVLGYCGSFKN